MNGEILGLWMLLLCFINNGEILMKMCRGYVSQEGLYVIGGGIYHQRVYIRGCLWIGGTYQQRDTGGSP